MNLWLVLSSVLLNCLAQVFMRKGMLLVGPIDGSELARSAFSMLTNLWLWGSMACYGVSVLLWMAVLSRVQVSFAYPFAAAGYVVAAALGCAFLGETVDMPKAIGIAVICLGVVILSRSGSVA